MGKYLEQKIRKLPNEQEYHFIILTVHTGPAPWAHDLCNFIGLLAQKVPTLSFMLCCYHLKCLKMFLTRGFAFSFCSRPCKCRQSFPQLQETPIFVVGQFTEIPRNSNSLHILGWASEKPFYPIKFEFFGYCNLINNNLCPIFN